MRLKVLQPDKVFLDTQVVKVIAEGANGHFCLEPRHVDFVSALVPGILTYVEEKGKTWYLAVDEGILVKCGMEVLVSTYKAILGEELVSLQARVEAEILKLDEGEQAARRTLARLEAGILRQYGGIKELF
ncbi:MAG: F0F1 ATP synthase subunit epsilon [Methylohalobius sp.]|nr:F0F1 ATP synthase subunit epsilon [Methylohalobius sp.]